MSQNGKKYFFVTFFTYFNNSGRLHALAHKRGGGIRFDINQLYKFFKMNILIIEDDPMVRKALSHHLQQHAHHLFAATNGQEAIQIIEKQKDIDLIICDVMMPVLTGPSFLLMLKNYYPKELPAIIIVSGAKVGEDFLRKIEIPYNHYISKPIDFSKLSDLVAQYESTKH
jgi:CheY-like chemotaxis protein